MKKLQNEFFLVFILFLLLDLLLFWKFFFKGFIPFPGDYLIAWYQPWKALHSSGEFITVSHKAIADDVFRQLYVYKNLIASAFINFSLPLWNPYNGAGMPLLATMHAGILTPFNLLFVFLPGFIAWGIYIAIQPVFVGFFTYLYCRKISLGRQSSIFAAVTFTLSGFVIVRLIFGEYIYVVSGLPLLLYFIESFAQDIYTRKIFFIPFIILFLCISGQPQIILYVLGLSFFYLLYKREFIGMKNVFFILFLFILGIGLSSIQLFPTLELFRNAAISTSSSSFIFFRFLLPLQHLITLFIPNYFGSQSTYNYWGYGDYIETIAYIGGIPVFFSTISFFLTKNLKVDVRKFYFITSFITILSTLNWIIPKVLFSLPIPVLSTGIPSRIFILTTFSISILAGYGFDNWLEMKKNSAKIVYTTGSFVFIMLFTWLITLLLFARHVSCGKNVIIQECRLVSLRNTTLEIIPFLFCAVLFFIFIKNKSGIFKFIPFVIVIFVASLGLYNANKFLPFSSKETILPDVPLLNFLKNTKDYNRAFGFEKANIKTDFATYFHFYDPQYYDPLYNKRYGELVAFANTDGLPEILPRSDVEIINEASVSADLKQRRERLFELLNVKYLIYSKNQNIPDQKNIIWQDNSWYVKNNANSLPKAYLVSNFEVVSDEKKILQKLFSPEFKTNNTVILENKPINFTISSEKDYKSKIAISDYRPNKVTLQTKSQNNGFLVISDNYFPGWKAFVDNKETKIFRANYTFRAIELPKGKNEVKFIYDLLSLKIGIAVSALSLFVIIFLLFQSRPYPGKSKR